MKKILLGLSILASASSSFALDQSEVKGIIDLVAAKSGSEERVVEVSASLNPIVYAGQINDLADNSVDWEFNKVSIVYKKNYSQRDAGAIALANCESLVRVDSNTFAATADIRSCVDSITGEKVSLQIQEAELAGAKMSFTSEGEATLTGGRGLLVVDASSIVRPYYQINEKNSALDVLGRNINQKVIKPIKGGMFQ